MSNLDYVIKMGGSAITNKEVPMSPNLGVIGSIARDIKSRGSTTVLLVYGGGSYGHAMARRYLVDGAILDPMGIAETRSAMLSLTKVLTEAFLSQEVPLLCLNPSSCFIIKEGDPVPLGFLARLLSKTLKAGLVPAIGGDVVLDRAGRGRIVSGDALARILALRLHARALLLGTDVDGVLSRRQLIREINPGALRQIYSQIGSRPGDVTGGMAGKLKEVSKYLSNGGRVSVIFNITRPGMLARLLKGEEIEATYIRSKHNGAG